MTPGWAVAVGLLAVLCLGLTVLVLRLLGAVSSLDQTVAGHHRSLAQGRGAEQAEVSGTPSSVLVLLEPSLADHRALAADIRAAAGLPVGLPSRVRVADSPAGRALVADFPVPVEFEQRTVPMTADAPCALVLDRAGRVVGGGTPTSLAGLRALVQDARGTGAARAAGVPAVS